MMIDVEIRILLRNLKTGEKQGVSRIEKMPFPPTVGLTLWLTGEDCDTRQVNSVAYRFDDFQYVAWLDDDDLAGDQHESEQQVSLADRVEEYEKLGWYRDSYAEPDSEHVP
jgi:hypothetical protein